MLKDNPGQGGPRRRESPLWAGDTAGQRAAWERGGQGRGRRKPVIPTVESTPRERVPSRAGSPSCLPGPAAGTGQLGHGPRGAVALLEAPGRMPRLSGQATLAPGPRGPCTAAAVPEQGGGRADGGEGPATPEAPSSAQQDPVPQGTAAATLRS